MLKLLMKIKKIRQSIFKIKILIIVLTILAVAGWGMAIYFLTRAQNPVLICRERLDKLHSYAVLLDRSTRLARQDKSFDILESDIHLLDNGTLLAEWQDVVFGGNQEEDLDNYFDVIIDSLNFFSK